MTVLAPPCRGALDSQGSDFWLAFQLNLGTPELSLFLTGNTDTSGTVEIPGLGFLVPFTVTANTVTTVAIPSTAMVSTSDGIEAKGIHVTALDEVTVYGLNRVQFTTDAFLGLPTDILETEYVNLGFQNVGFGGTHFAVVAIANGTVLTIIPSVTTGVHAAGVPYTVNLNQGEVYQLQNDDSAIADLSGTGIASNLPVAVYGGHLCANVPDGNTFACDHLVEQLPPTVTWGKNFVTMPLATRTGGDTFRFIASNDITTVQVSGVTVATLDRGEVHQMIIDGPSQITSDQPILVAQYSNGSSFDGAVSDPFMMLIPPFEQFLGDYTVTTPATGFTQNFINVVAPDAAVGQITLDGVPIPAASFTSIGTSGFSGVQAPVSLGSHNLNGPLPFGAFVYGFADFDSYGYPGGLSLAPIVLVTTVALTPEADTNPVNTEHCVAAHVTDQNGDPVEGVRVDFSVTGANSTAGFAATDASGNAQFCYTGTNAGSDTITASVGTLSDTAAKTWTEEPGGPPREEICRTAGFWGTHGGQEKDGRSTNITLALLKAFNDANDPDLTICGTPLTNTDLGSQNSALEAVCVSPKGNNLLQLGRQLTATALNCIITKAAGNPEVEACEFEGAGLTSPVCENVTIGTIFDACNQACAASELMVLLDLDEDLLTPDVEVSCIGALDCFNSGGFVDPTSGECLPCDPATVDPVTDACPPTCEDLPLCADFEPPGAAGSPRECNDSRKNCMTIFGPIEGCIE